MSWKSVECKVKGCSKSFYKLEDEFLIDKLSREICSYWSGEEFDDKIRFPGAQPVSIEMKDFKTLKSNKYVVCAKLDGERYFLLCTKVPKDLSEPDGEQLNVSFMVNRNMEFYIISLECPENVYSGETLLDGELLDNQFIVHDAIVLAGNFVKMSNWDIRWKTTDKFIMNSIRMNANNTLAVKLKKFYDIKGVSHLFQEMSSSGIPTDGLVFYPVEEPIGYKTQNSLFKWKPPGHHTIDFVVNINEDNNVDLITWSGGKEVVYTTLSLSKFEEIGSIKNGDVVEFESKFLGAKPIFKPITKRIDKPKGNNLFTVRKTLKNVKENIQKNDIIRILS